MSSGTKQATAFDIFDPFGIYKQFRDSLLENTAKSMVDMVNTEAYAQATGAMLNGYLDVAEPVREWMEKVMPPVLAHYGLPSRKELLSVASRMTNIEMRLDDIEATLEEIRNALQECPERQTERKAA